MTLKLWHFVILRRCFTISPNVMVEKLNFSTKCLRMLCQLWNALYQWHCVEHGLIKKDFMRECEIGLLINQFNWHIYAVLSSQNILACYMLEIKPAIRSPRTQVMAQIRNCIHVLGSWWPGLVTSTKISDWWFILKRAKNKSSCFLLNHVHMFKSYLSEM